ncbi:MAG: hypothetical protein KJ749_00610 [Planctomycetes bacterium]|nr:hypothetical protein [Planctomycetota bacterium]
MDVSAGLRDLLTNQSFRKSPLYRDVFPLGSQDAVQSLLDACGGDPVVAFMKYLDDESTQRGRSTDSGEPPARERLCFSGCDCGVYDPE